MTRQRFGGACLLLVLMLGPGCGPRPQTVHEFVEQLHEDGNYEASLPHLQGLLQASPDDSHASYLLGVALARTDQPGPAVWPLLRAAENEAHAPAAGRLLAQLLLESRNPEAAVDAASAALRSAPDDPDLLRIRGHAFLAAHEPEAALTDGDALLEIRPGDLEALALRASALVALERLEEAEVAFERLAELSEASGDPRQATRGCLARASFRIRIDGGSEPARSAALACAERFPDDLGVLQTVSALLDRAENGDAATQLLRRARTRAPNDPALGAMLASRLELAGDVDGAEALWRETAEALDSAAAYQALAGFYRRHDRKAETLSALTRAIDRGGDAPDALLFTQVDLLIDLGELEAAAAKLAEIEDPALRRLLEGRLALVRGAPEAALAALDAGLLAWPDNPGARALAAQAAARIGDADRALAEYRAAFRAQRANPAPALAAARLHMALGDPDSALMLMRMIAGRAGLGSEPYLLMARAHTLRGEFELARRALVPLETLEDAALPLWLERSRITSHAEGSAAAARVLEASGLDWTLAENEPGLTALAEFHAEAGEVDSALAAIDGALARAPRVSLHDLRGRILLSARREQEALDAFRAARALDPQSPGPRVGLALLALREGRLREASLHVDRALEAEQLDPAAGYAAARILRLLGRRDEARAQLEAVIREDPGHASACTDLARLLAEQATDLDRALALARRAERIEPGAEAAAAVAYVEGRRRQRTN